jgi:hypothetical protein
MAVMRSNPFVRFHRAAEAADYPALLIVSLVALTVVLAGLLLLAMVGGVSAFAFAMLTLAIGVALEAGGILAALSDDEDPPTGRPVGPRAS